MEDHVESHDIEMEDISNVSNSLEGCTVLNMYKYM